jgi:hypothetical protein
MPMQTAPDRGCARESATLESGISLPSSKQSASKQTSVATCDRALRVAAWSTAACWIALSVLFLVQPEALTPGISFPLGQSVDQIGDFWQARPDTSAVHIGLHLWAAITALATIGFIAYATRALDVGALWTSRLAIVGMGVLALSNVRYLPMEKTYARLFLDASLVDRTAVAVASASLSLDPYGVLEFGAVGAWMVAVTLALGARRTWLLASAAAIGAAGLFGMVIGASVWAPALDVAPILGTPGLVVWVVCLAGVLLKEHCHGETSR